MALDDGETATHFIPATEVDSIAAKSVQIEAADIAALLYADKAVVNDHENKDVATAEYQKLVAAKRRRDLQI